MEPQHENRADQLEKLLSSHSGQYSSAQKRTAVPDGVDAEMYEMVTLAQQLRRSPALIPDPAFAQRLERKILAHRVVPLQTNQQQDKPHWLMSGIRVSRVQLICSIFLLCLLISSNTILAKASTVSNPSNPLYRIKVWEQQVELSLATSPQSRADISLQIISDRLNTITSLTGASNASAYQQALDDIQQQIDTASSIIDTLPAGLERQNLSTELATLKIDIRHTLYSLLAKIPLAEQLSTSSMLGQLGVPVPGIQSVAMVILTHPTNQATITITGTNLTGSTHLIVNYQVIPSACELQNNSCTFTISWHGKKTPTIIAVMNADGTTAQTTSTTSVSVNGNHNNGYNATSNNGVNKHNSSKNKQAKNNWNIQSDNNGSLALQNPGNNPQQYDGNRNNPQQYDANGNGQPQFNWNTINPQQYNRNGNSPPQYNGKGNDRHNNS